MQKEREAEVRNAEENFKNLIFANDIKLYDRIFGTGPKPLPGQTVVNENPDDLVIPQTAGDIANLLADLKDLGLDLHETEIR